MEQTPLERKLKLKIGWMKRNHCKFSLHTGLIFFAFGYKYNGELHVRGHMCTPH